MPYITIKTDLFSPSKQAIEIRGSSIVRAREKCIRRSKQNIKWFAFIYVIFIKVFAHLRHILQSKEPLKRTQQKRSKTDGVIERESKKSLIRVIFLRVTLYMCVYVSILLLAIKNKQFSPNLTDKSQCED